MKLKGYVALTTILILVPLLLLTGVDLLYRNITTLSVSKMNYDSQILRTNTETCLEETVYRLKRDIGYTGEYAISNDNWECIVNVFDSGDGIKILSLSITDENGIKKVLRKELDIKTNPFTLSNLE